MDEVIAKPVAERIAAPERWLDCLGCREILYTSGLRSRGGLCSFAAMRESIIKLLGRPVDFPARITLSSGDTYLLPHPDHLQMHPNTRDLVVYADDGPFSLVVNPAQIVSIEALRQAS